MRHIIDVECSNGESAEIDFSKNHIGEFLMVVRNCETQECIELILHIDDLKELNALSFKCRKEAEKDVKKYRKEVNNG